MKNRLLYPIAAAFLAALPALPQSGQQAILGVGEITTSIRGADPASFQTMIETQLVKVNKFKMVERSRLVEILKEKGLGSAGLTTGTNTQLSGIQGVDYLIYGTITKLGASGSSTAVGGVSFGSKVVEMAVDLRIIDAHNGEIILAETVGEQNKGASAISMRGFSNSSKEADPLADVERLTAKSIAGLITTKIYPIKIIAKQVDGTIVVNYGDSVLTKGDNLRVFKLGESFKDPDTGKVLGSEESEIGRVTVTETTATFSKTLLVSGNVEVGNTARRLGSTEATSRQPDKKSGATLPR